MLKLKLRLEISNCKQPLLKMNPSLQGIDSEIKSEKKQFAILRLTG
jgi:hypothetical protein